MTLLQIMEPDEPASLKKTAIGIDLGTTHSLVAAVIGDTVSVFTDDAGQALLPSVVRYGKDGVISVGRQAREDASMDPSNTVVSVKRFMGRAASDITPAERRSLVFKGDGAVVIDTAAGLKTPVDVSADILSELVKRVPFEQDELVGAVITVPAYFDDAQRQATKEAAEKAGLSVMRLLSEPTAAAIAYGLQNGTRGTYCAYDLGGGTFDVSVLSLEDGVFEVLATAGDTHLGGDDFDRALFDEVVREAGVGNLPATDAAALLAACRSLKEKLSASDKETLSLKISSGKTVSVTVTRERFEDITAGLIGRTLSHVKSALSDASLSEKDIDGVILIGGATRMPCVRNAVASRFASAIHDSIDPDKVVAIGAARQASLLAGQADSWLLLDVIPLSLGIETMGGLTEKIITRNATIPCAYAREFTTFKDGQTALSVHVLQGERELASECRSLAKFELRGFPAMAAGVARIKVTFEVDADALLHVSAEETTSGTKASVDVIPSLGLTDSDVAGMLEAGRANVAADREKRLDIEARVEAESVRNAVMSALAADADLLTEAEKEELFSAVSDVENAIASNERRKMLDATSALSAKSEPFAVKRMNKSIKAALTGRDVDSL